RSRAKDSAPAADLFGPRHPPLRSYRATQLTPTLRSSGDIFGYARWQAARQYSASRYSGNREVVMGQAHHASVNPVARRRSQRVLMQVAVRIRGEDVQGKNIEEETETLAINAHGALVLMKARVTSGSKVLLQ